MLNVVWQVIAFSESGDYIGPVLEAGQEYLQPGKPWAGALAELRGMLQYANHLYVVNSFRDDSRVVIFGPRNTTTGTAHGARCTARAVPCRADSSGSATVGTTLHCCIGAALHLGPRRPAAARAYCKTHVAHDACCARCAGKHPFVSNFTRREGAATSAPGPAVNSIAARPSAREIAQ